MTVTKRRKDRIALRISTELHKQVLEHKKKIELYASIKTTFTSVIEKLLKVGLEHDHINKE
jgi:hypothetical protein